VRSAHPKDLIVVDDAHKQRRRGIRIVGGVLLSTAVVGYFIEVRRPAPAPAGYAMPHAGPVRARDVRSYAELRQGAANSDRSLYVAEVSTLRTQLPKLTDSFERKPGDRQAALARRAVRRAYDGAPPTVPHPVDERAVPNCSVCHQDGARIGDVIAPAMSHAPFQSCQQCHVPGAVTAPPLVAANDAHGQSSSAPWATKNEFTALRFGGVGERAWIGAPPVMPHPLWMRQQCDSCHGVSGHPGLRTSHPERQSCVQCHAPQAALEQSLGWLAHRAEAAP
jgi:nitrate reductase (cytochrome), electron transfer subunit